MENDVASGRLLRLRAVLDLTGLSRSRWLLGVQRGEFPRPVHLPPRTTAWREADIRALIETAPEAERWITVARKLAG